MNRERLLELAGVPLVEAMPNTTKENPLVHIWDSAESKEYPEQGLAGHMHLTTAQNIYRFEIKGLAEEIWEAGVGKRVKAGKVWLEMSKWTKKEIKAGGRDKAIAKEDLKENEKNWEEQEDKMMVELQPLKKQLDAIMSKYPHASYDDVLDWLKQ